MAERFGEELVRAGDLGADQLKRAVDAQRLVGGRLGTNLLELGMTTESTLLDNLGRYRASCTVSRADLSGISQSVLRSIPEKMARRYQMIPYRIRGKTLFIASLDPGDFLREDEISFLTSFMVRTCVGLELHIRLALRQYYQVPIDRRYLALAKRLSSGSGIRPAPTRQQLADMAPQTAPGPSETPGGTLTPSGSFRAPPPAFDVPATPAPSRPNPAPARPTSSAETQQPSVEFIEIDAEELALLRKPNATSAEQTTHHDLTPTLHQPPPAPRRQEPPGPTPSAALAPAPLPPGPLPPEPLPPGPLPPDPQLPGVLSPPSTSALPTESASESASDGAEELDLESRLRLSARELQSADIRDEIGDVLLDFSGVFFRRRVLLIARRERIVGWRGAGEGVDEAAIRALDLDAQAPSVFAGLRDASSFWLGPLPQLPINRQLLTHLNGPAPKDCLVLPVVLRSKIVCHLYVDNLERSVAGGPIAEMKRLVGKAGLAFEVYILKNKIRVL